MKDDGDQQNASKHWPLRDERHGPSSSWRCERLKRVKGCKRRTRYERSADGRTATLRRADEVVGWVRAESNVKIRERRFARVCDR
ncbi:hypothetical protein V9T40_007917 [Parthenolecanium corni]|uniref:Uncharacterized protein n=1 Tax=Parthenolecanium corni TaxID=536013 RepID=A0AAN9Y703_9HEMI